MRKGGFYKTTNLKFPVWAYLSFHLSLLEIFFWCPYLGASLHWNLCLSHPLDLSIHHLSPGLVLAVVFSLVLFVSFLTYIIIMLGSLKYMPNETRFNFSTSNAMRSIPFDLPQDLLQTFLGCLSLVLKPGKIKAIKYKILPFSSQNLNNFLY